MDKNRIDLEGRGVADHGAGSEAVSGTAGQVVGHVGKLPPVWDKIRCHVTLMERVVGATSELIIEPLKFNEPLMLSVGTAVTVGVVTNTKKDAVEVQLKRPVCAEQGARIAISRQVGARWRLIGMGVLTE